MKSFATSSNIDSSADNGKVHKRNQSTKYTRLTGAGRKSGFRATTIKRLRDFLDDKRKDDYSVSVQMLMAEARRVDPVSCMALHEDAFRSRVHRLLHSWEISWRRATHKAHRTRLCEQMVADFQFMVMEKIHMLNIPPQNVYNVDRTNCYYSMEARLTLAEMDQRKCQ
jgi:hypothetical protein